MIRIHRAKRLQREGTVCFSARIERDKGYSKLPSNLWYEVSEDIAKRIEPDAAPFTLPLLHLAMELNEPLYLDGPICERLLNGIRAYQELFHSWFPRRFHVIDICCGGANKKKKTSTKSATASAFSGGVDSFYTLWSSLYLPQPVERLSHGLFVHGFDIPLSDNASFDAAAEAYRPLLRHFGMELMTLRTNVREFRPDWEMSHGAALAAAAHLLTPYISKFVIPTSKSSDTLCPWGSDPRVDPLLSGEGLEVIHDDATPNRLDKLLAMEGWWPLTDHLRICWEYPNGLVNCCRCNDCNFTMIEMDAIGTLGEIRTFPLPPREKDYKRLHYLTDHERKVGAALISEARRRNREDIARCVSQAIRYSHFVHLRQRFVSAPLRRIRRMLRLAYL